MFATIRSGRLPILIMLQLLACTGDRPAHLGHSDSALAPCPSSPNCVSSDAETEPQHVVALQFSGHAEAAWQRARVAVMTLPRTRIVQETPTNLHAECTSALLRFRDDLELQLRPEHGEIAVRSASRSGYSDMGVNRARVEALRAAFDEGAN
jgi:uncharacterized protein (DUF1499 family)